MTDPASPAPLDLEALLKEFNEWLSDTEGERNCGYELDPPTVLRLIELAREAEGLRAERDAVELPMTEICGLLGCDDCDDAPGAVRALTAERDALRAQLQTAREALELLWAETVASGNGSAGDYGWPKARAATLAVLAAIKKETQS